MATIDLPDAAPPRRPRHVPLVRAFVQRITEMPSVGERIRKRRNELGWTQDSLATKAGVSKSFLSDL